MNAFKDPHPDYWDEYTNLDLRNKGYLDGEGYTGRWGPTANPRLFLTPKGCRFAEGGR
jgi:hypothetical protein